jgi:hypothetical protein
MTKYLILASIVVIILIFFSYRCGQNRAEMGLLQGFWESNSEFNKESGLQMFTFYIGDKYDGKYPAYLLMVEAGDDQTILINEPTSFTIAEPYMNTLSRDDCNEMYLRFSNLETSLLPSIMTMKFYPQTGKLVLCDHKKIYAVFFKNPVLSEMERIKKEKDSCMTNQLDDDDGGGGGGGDDDGGGGDVDGVDVDVDVDDVDGDVDGDDVDVE